MVDAPKTDTQDKSYSMGSFLDKIKNNPAKTGAVVVGVWSMIKGKGAVKGAVMGLIGGFLLPKAINLVKGLFENKDKASPQPEATPQYAAASKVTDQTKSNDIASDVKAAANEVPDVDVVATAEVKDNNVAPGVGGSPSVDNSQERTA